MAYGGQNPLVSTMSTKGGDVAASGSKTPPISANFNMNSKVSSVQNPYWFIGILILAYNNPQYNPLCQTANQGS